MVPASLYDGHLVHVRREPLPRVFRHRIHLWLVDLDELPVLPWWIRLCRTPHQATKPYWGWQSAACWSR